MFTLPFGRGFAGAAVLAFALVGLAAATAGGAAQGPAERNELLAEVRALRAEINQAAGTSLRAQLLVARLQLQEGRIRTLAQQLTDLRNQLASVGQARAGFALALEKGEDPDRLPQDHPLRQMFEQHQKREWELKQQEASVMALLSDEQSRWVDFNSRLEELERALPASPTR